MGSLSVRIIGFAIAIIMLATGSIAVLALLSANEAEVDAAKSPTEDGGGYIWVDNRDPEPKIEYDWIDAAGDPNSEYLSGAYNYYYSYGNYYEEYELPFDFPFYDQTHRTVRVLACGYIDVNGFQNNGYYYFYNGLPDTSYEDGVIAAWAYAIGAYRDTKGDFKIFALEGETYGEKWVCFEWNKAYAPGSYSRNSGSSYQITFEIVLYESGLIKMQYKDADTSYSWYNNGNYAVAGIEDHQGQRGLEYSGRDDSNLKDGLAVMFGKNILEVDDVRVDSDEGGAVYAMHRDYSVTTHVKHPVNNDMVRVVAVELGNGIASMQFFMSSDGSYYFTKEDPFNFLYLNSEASGMKITNGFLEVDFKFSPSFAYPSTSFQDVKVSVMGAGAMPAGKTVRDAFWIENRLEMAGSLVAYSDNVGLIENGGWVKGAEQFYFRGIKAVYPGTLLQPMQGTFTFTATDEIGNEYVQENVETASDIPVTAENDLVKKVYTLNITGVPPGTDISDPVQFELNVDPYRPSAPKEVLIHADSFDDRNTEYDDDNEVFISWEPAEDFESGVAGYYISVQDPLSDDFQDEEPLFVESPDTSAIYLFENLGTRKIYVWAVDRAGNPSVPSYSITKIDATEVTFSEFSPGHQVWVNTRNPVCSVLIDDQGGSGVSAQDLQYSTSTTNQLEFSAWRSSNVLRDSEQIRLSMKALFDNGKTNWVRFRAKDVAGNGWTMSKNYNVWVDEEKPSFVNFRPYEVEYQNGKTVVVSVDITDSHSTREGSGIRLDTVEYRMTTQGKGLFGSWVEAPISSVDREGKVHIEMELDFREGTENYIQFRCYDDVGNYASSRAYNIKVNSAPIVDAFISEPMNEEVHTTSEKIRFDASGTSDPDGDDLTFTWYSDINGFLSDTDSFYRSLSPGVHVITLVVNDPAHSIVKTFDLEVLEETQIDPTDIDSDGDGIYDAWEEKYFLDPETPDSFLDTDKDKFTNLQEFQNGTDPTRSVSHPPYPDFEERKDPTEVDDTEDQYQSITLGLGMLALLIVIVLVLLAYSKYRSFRMEREEERDLELEEMDYRNALEQKKE